MKYVYKVRQIAKCQLFPATLLRPDFARDPLQIWAVTMTDVRLCESAKTPPGFPMKQHFSAILTVHICKGCEAGFDNESMSYHTFF